MLASAQFVCSTRMSRHQLFLCLCHIIICKISWALARLLNASFFSNLLLPLPIPLVCLFHLPPLTRYSTCSSSSSLSVLPSKHTPMPFNRTTYSQKPNLNSQLSHSSCLLSSIALIPSAGSSGHILLAATTRGEGGKTRPGEASAAPRLIHARTKHGRALDITLARCNVSHHREETGESGNIKGGGKGKRYDA